MCPSGLWKFHPFSKPDSDSSDFLDDQVYYASSNQSPKSSKCNNAQRPICHRLWVLSEVSESVIPFSAAWVLANWQNDGFEQRRLWPVILAAGSYCILHCCLASGLSCKASPSGNEQELWAASESLTFNKDQPNPRFGLLLFTQSLCIGHKGLIPSFVCPWWVSTMLWCSGSNLSPYIRSCWEGCVVIVYLLQVSIVPL